MGRPSVVTNELLEAILDGLIEGKSLRKICEAEDMPNRSTVLRWLDADEDFAAKYARARVMQADHMDDLILEAAEACKPDTAAADRVKIDAYKWRASKLNPKRYGDATLHKIADADGKKIDPSSTEGVTRLAALAHALLQQAADVPDDAS
jgi:hypothetical protein